MSPAQEKTTEQTATADERKRLDALEQYRILDTEPEPQFDEIARLAAHICSTPMAAVTLVDDRRQWFKARIGFSAGAVPRSISFCAATIESKDMVVIPDASVDPRFSGNPQVVGEPHIRFYAGVPLLTRDGLALGTLSVMDHIRRELEEGQRQALSILSREVVLRLELRKSLDELAQAVLQRDHAVQQLRLSHEKLEFRIRERTSALNVANARLRQQFAQQEREATELQALIDSLPGIFYVFDANGKFLRWNRNFERVTGYTHEEVARSRPLDFFGAEASRNMVEEAIRRGLSEGCSSVEADLVGKDGRRTPYYFSGVRVEIGGCHCISGMGVDISDIKNYEARLAHQENFDALTELASRSALKERIRQAITLAQRNNGVVAVGFMDLDNFKLINDSLGHNIGDKLLKLVAERLAACFREHDMVARYGGDEFAFVLTGQKDDKSVAALMQRVLKTVDRPFNIDGHQLYVSCSIGISFYPKDGLDVDTLLRDADAAMYRAKDSGRNNFQFYTPSMNLRVTERLSMEARLRRALANDEFVLHYQPKVDLRSGAMVGVEALLRWCPANGETVPPAAFIPLAEETGLIVAIGEWVLRTACADSRMLQDAGLAATRVAVNISARQFEPDTLTALVGEALRSSGLAAEFLELELTESLVMQNPEEVIKVLRDLRDMGVRLAIDDFGTGYSSLSYLQRFPVDRLKIDQSFVRDIGADPNDAIIARAVISLGHSLGMSVIAEGVSSREQLAFLRENGCDEMQGYLFSQPLPIEELAALLRENRILQ